MQSSHQPALICIRFVNIFMIHRLKYNFTCEMALGHCSIQCPLCLLNDVLNY